MTTTETTFEPTTAVMIPPDATIQERLTLMSFLGHSEPLWNFAGDKLSVVGVVAVDSYRRDENGVQVLDEDGACIPCKLTLWRTEDGKLYHSSSNVAYGFCRDKLWPVMTQDGRPGMLLAPVVIKIGSQGTRSGRRTFKFDIG